MGSGASGGEAEFERWREIHLGRLLLRAVRIFERDVLRGYRERGMRPDRVHLPVLRNLSVEGARIGELARRADLSKQSAGRIVRELERLGVVEVTVDPADARARIVRFTDAGLEGLHVGRAVVDEVVEQYARELGRDRVRNLTRILADFVEAFEEPDS